MHSLVMYNPGDTGWIGTHRMEATAPQPNHLKLALLKAQLSLPGIEKNAENKFGKYNYVSVDAAVIAARTALLEAGLVLSANNWFASKVGEQDFVTTMYTLAHPASGEEEQLGPFASPVTIERGKPYDKSQMAAVSYQLTYVLRGLLMTPRVDDIADVDSRDDRNVQPNNAQPNNGQPAAQANGAGVAEYMAHMQAATSKAALDKVAKEARVALGVGADKLAGHYASCLQRLGAASNG